ncbi:MAG: T9SS type A sorting domain-containing protein [Chryseolinea sp.]
MKSILYLLIFALSFTTSVGWTQSHSEYASLPDRAVTDPTKAFQIFPNPTTDYIHIRNEQVEMSLLKLTLHNIIGNEMQVEVEVVDEHELKVKVKDLSPGYYLIAVKDDFSKFRGTYKFLKR